MRFVFVKAKKKQTKQKQMTDLTFSVLQAVERINAAIRKGVAEDTVNELMNPDAQLPTVYPRAAELYQRELFSLQQQSSEVRTFSHTCTHTHMRSE